VPKIGRTTARPTRNSFRPAGVLPTKAASSGLLPTDRPNTFKGYTYYELNWLHKFTTTFGIFQVVYQGTPEASYVDVGFGFPGGFPTYPFNIDKVVTITQDPTTGLITVSNPRTQRTPWYNQTDFNVQQDFKIGESKALSFQGTLTNLLNERSVTAVGEQIDSNTSQNFIGPALRRYGADEWSHFKQRRSINDEQPVRPAK
jgi:hypothetical protein